MTDNSDFIPMDDAPAGNAGKSSPSKSDKVVEAMLNAGLTCSRTSRGRVIVSVPNGTKIERYDLYSHKSEMVIRRCYGEANRVHGKQGSRWSTIPQSALKEAIATFEATSWDVPISNADVRLVRHEGAIWLDLARADGKLVRVTENAWTVVEQADVPLIRSDGMEALPIPKPDPNALENLVRLLNLGSKDHLMVTVAFLLAALWPTGPYPLLAFDGEQGSGKTTASKICRRLVDPNASDLRAPPRTEVELLIAAQMSRVMAFDNVSSISPDMADALCRLSNGGGISTRELYTNSSESRLWACRPVLLNGIPQVVTRADLADRTLVITLRRITRKERRKEAVIERELEAAAPGILALLLDGIVKALQHQDTLELPYLERLADFTAVACAAAPAFGWTKEEMLAALERNKAEAAEAVLDAEPIAWAIRRLAVETAPDPWTGTATELMQIVNRILYDHFGHQRWRNAARFSGSIRRIALPLQRAGVAVTWGGRVGPDGSRIIIIELTTPEVTVPEEDSRRQICQHHGYEVTHVGPRCKIIRKKKKAGA
jgi:hypothetical protein